MRDTCVPIDKPSKDDTEYWEKVLLDHHLNMGRGKRRWLVYGHEYFDGDGNNESPEDTE